MASIRIQHFAGIRPELSDRLIPATTAQIAHNCLLTDGSLRAQAEWVRLQEYDSAFSPEIRGIAYDWTTDATTMYASFDPVTLTGEPFAEGLTVGASPDSIVCKYSTGAGLQPTPVAVYAGGVAGTVRYSRTYDSIKPVNRIYALTRVRKIGNRAEEGALIPIPGQDPAGVLYEGDLVTVEINASALDDGATHIRLYRTISGLDTGESVANALDTEWHLVGEMPLRHGNLETYTDGSSATALPLDVCYSQNFFPPQVVARYFGLTESGWFVVGSLGGDIQISERYMHHAWPVDNHLRLQGEEIVDLAIYKDNAFVGTLAAPYVVSMAVGEEGVQASATPFPEAIPCLPNSMAPAAGGAIYASGQGLVALSREGLQVLSREVANAGDVLYSKTLPDGRVSTAKISNTSFGAYFQGKYIGFCEGPPIDDGVYLTSTLYPIDSTEGITSDGSYIASSSIVNGTETLSVSATFVSGELRATVQELDARIEYLGVEGGFEQGELVDILRNITLVPEEINASAELTRLELINMVVETIPPPEEINASAELIEVKLYEP